MRKRIVGGSIFCSNNRRTCLLNFLIQILNEKCHGYTHMLQDNPPYILATATATATVVQLVTLAQAKRRIFHATNQT